MRTTERSIAAKYKQSIQGEALYTCTNFIRDINDNFLTIPYYLARVRVATICRSQNGSAARQNSAYAFNT